jgi:hypothetical protein
MWQVRCRQVRFEAAASFSSPAGPSLSLRPCERSEVCYRKQMRQLLIATAALLVLSGCNTSGLNPLKIEGEGGWRLTPGVERLLALLIGRTD